MEHQAAAIETYDEVDEAGDSSFADYRKLGLEGMVDLVLEQEVADLILEDMATASALFGIMQRILPLDAEASSRLAESAAGGHVSSHDYLVHARNHLLDHANEDALAAALTFNHSETGRKWTAAARQAMTMEALGDPDARSWIDETLKEAQHDPTLAMRVELVRAIEEASSHTERGIETLVMLAKMVLDSMYSLLPNELKPSKEHTRAVREDITTSLVHPALEELLYQSYLYSTRDLSAEELRAVMSYYSDGPGETMLDIFLGATRKACSAYIEALVRDLAERWASLG